MPVENEIIEQVVAKILERLAVSKPVENVRVLQAGSAGEVVLPEGELPRRIYYSDDNYAGVAVDRYILPRLEPADMADLAMGKAGSPVAEEVLALLLQGKSVEVLSYGYTDFEETAAAGLLNLYRDYAKTLEGFGLQPVKQVRRTTQLTKRVVSENDIEKCRDEGVRLLSVASNSLVTSLAEETARKYGIEITRNGKGV